MSERFQPISVEVDGRRYAGDFQLQGRDVCVGSAYGSRRAPLMRAKPETVAARVLRDLVREWARDRHS